MLLAHCPNPEPQKKVSSLVTKRIDVVTRQGRIYKAVFFTSEEFPDKEIYCALHYCHVVEECPPEDLFDQIGTNKTVPNDPVVTTKTEEGTEINPSVFNSGNRAKDIEFVRNQGLEVDDDNDPAPENVPQGNEVQETHNLLAGQAWGFDCIDQRAITGAVDQSPKFQGGWNPKKKTILEIFLKLLPWNFFIDTIIMETSNVLVAEKLTPLMEGEFLWYIGLWFLMATVCGFHRKDYWSTKDFDERTNPCPFSFSSYMSKQRFDSITRQLRFTSRNPPAFMDRFWEVREMIVEWNKNMATVFVPSWVLCLDDSMSIWHSMFTCPGWVFCPRKPHPFGNEYHNLCCAKSGVLTQLELVEGKDRPKEMGHPLFHEKGKTVGLLLHLLEPYFTLCRYVVLDLGFCVLKGIIELRKRGIFVGALIKKRRYLPTLVPGDAFDSGCPLDKVDELMTLLARMHASFWIRSEKGETSESFRLSSILNDRSGKLSATPGVGHNLPIEKRQASFANSWPAVRKRLLPFFQSESKEYLQQLDEIVKWTAQSPRIENITNSVGEKKFTLIHGDFHVGNKPSSHKGEVRCDNKNTAHNNIINEAAASSRPWLVDWSMSGIGNPLIDLVFFLVVGADVIPSNAHPDRDPVANTSESLEKILRQYHLTLNSSIGDDSETQNESFLGSESSSLLRPSLLSRDEMVSVFRQCLLNQFIILVCYDDLCRSMAEASPDKESKELLHCHFDRVNVRCVNMLLSEFGWREEMRWWGRRVRHDPSSRGSTAENTIK